MPSPIAHSAVAFVLWPVARNRGLLGEAPPPVASGRGLVLLGGLLFMLNAPDLDMAPHLLLGEPSWLAHGAATHSVFFGAVAAMVFAMVLRPITGVGLTRLWLLGAIAWWSHILLDFFTLRGGVSVLWPLTDERFASPVPLFYGVRHSEPWAWRLHLITISTELIFLFALWLVGRRLNRRGGSAPLASAIDASEARRSAAPRGCADSPLRPVASDV